MVQISFAKRNPARRRRQCELQVPHGGHAALAAPCANGGVRDAEVFFGDPLDVALVFGEVAHAPNLSTNVRGGQAGSYDGRLTLGNADSSNPREPDDPPSSTLPEMAALLADTKAFGRRLKLARERRGYVTQRALADALDVSFHLPSTWELGKAHPNPEHLGKLRLLLGVTSDWLLYGDMSGLSEEAYQLLILDKGD